MKPDFLKGKKVIIFDLDGTLIDSIGMWNDIDYMTIRELANKETDKNILQKQRENITNKKNIGDVYETYRKFLIEKYGIPYDLEFVTKWRKEYVEKYIIENIDYKKDAEKVLKELKKKGFTLVLATITSKKLIEKYDNLNQNLKNKAKLSETFDLILTTDEVKAKKPSPEVYLRVLEKLSVNPEECIVVEDSLEGVQAAKFANMSIINIVDEFSKENQDKIDEISDYRFNNFTDFLNEIKNKKIDKKVNQIKRHE